jgi:hypothetical protein
LGKGKGAKRGSACCNKLPEPGALCATAGCKTKAAAAKP